MTLFRIIKHDRKEENPTSKPGRQQKAQLLLHLQWQAKLAERIESGDNQIRGKRSKEKKIGV